MVAAMKRKPAEDSKPDYQGAEKQFLQMARHAHAKGGSRDEQTNRLMKHLKQKPKLLSLLAEKMLLSFIRDTLAHVQGSMVSQLKFQPNRCSRGADAIASTSETRLASWLDLTLDDGRIFGDLMGKELDKLIADAGAKANGWVIKSRFFSAVRQQTEDDEIVREKFDESRISLLWKEASGVGQGGSDAQNRIADSVALAGVGDQCGAESHEPGVAAPAFAQ